VSDRSDSRERFRTELVGRVRARRGELEEAIFARVRSEDLGVVGADDADYVAGLRVAVATAIEHALLGIELGEERCSESIPGEMLAQARRAAHAGVSLDTVLRRCVLGSTLVGDRLMQEVAHCDSEGCGVMLREVMSTQAAVLDRLMAAITSEYTYELERAGRSPEQRLAERVQRLLVGGKAETAELGYELDLWHVGLIATGVRPCRTLQGMAAALGSRLLCVPEGEELAWGWLGGRQALPAQKIEGALEHDAHSGVSLALGEPAWGLEGWRLTHSQAQAAQSVALHSPRQQRVTRYADVALLASVLRDEGLAGSLVDIYLSPLGSDHNGGALRETLRAYFSTECNAASTASALGVTRRTVQNRLGTIEQRLGHALHTRQAELEVALRLEGLRVGVSEKKRSIAD
jgi:hypothetical protein